MKRNIIIGALLLILGFVMGILCRPNHIREVTQKVTDTLVVTDTHIIEKPVLVERTIKNSSLVAVVDTMWIHDTCYIALPMETKTYKGEEYYAEVSGYKPSLDCIEVYPKTTTIKETITQSVTNCHALGIGLETMYLGTLYTPIYIEYEHMPKKWLSVYGKLSFDLPTKTYGASAGVKVGFGW